VGVPPRLRSTGEGGNGVNTLETMAIRCLLNNLESLEQQSLEGLPEVLVRRVWGEVARR
jgi:hypothetical protein